MQTARAFKLVEGGEAPARRHRGRPLRAVDPRPSRSRRAPRKTGPGSRGWVKTLLMVIVIAAEWLLVAADVFSRLYVLAG